MPLGTERLDRGEIALHFGDQDGPVDSDCDFSGHRTADCACGL
jgi:hypothetical protein